MILAAGEGRRLGAITDRRPKALVELGGRTALARVAGALAATGVDRLVVNAHHHADLVEEAALGLASDRLRVRVSREDAASDVPLETGGGLAFARALLDAGAPFFLHNVDILTDVDLGRLYEAHVAGEAEDGRLATLVVTRRETSRPLRVDDRGVFARVNRTEGWEVVARTDTAGRPREVGFSGIHVLSPNILAHFGASGAYSIMDVYMRLIEAGEVIGTFDASDATWHDIGTPERLEAARNWVEGGA